MFPAYLEPFLQGRELVPQLRWMRPMYSVPVFCERVDELRKVIGIIQAGTGLELDFTAILQFTEYCDQIAIAYQRQCLRLQHPLRPRDQERQVRRLLKAIAKSQKERQLYSFVKAAANTSVVVWDQIGMLMPAGRRLAIDVMAWFAPDGRFTCEQLARLSPHIAEIGMAAYRYLDILMNRNAHDPAFRPGPKGPVLVLVDRLAAWCAVLLGREPPIRTDGWFVDLVAALLPLIDEDQEAEWLGESVRTVLRQRRASRTNPTEFIPEKSIVTE